MNKNSNITQVQNTKNGEGLNRSGKAKRNITWSFLIKLVGIGISLVLVPLTLTQINASQYGVWLTLSSFVGWFSVMDIGFGNGLKNKFAQSIAKGEYSEAKAYVSTTYAVLFLLSGILFLVFILIEPHLNWVKILNAPFINPATLSNLALLVVLLFCIQFVLQPIYTMLAASQESAKAAVFVLLGNVFSVIAIYFLAEYHTGDLLSIGLVYTASPVISMVVATVWCYLGTYREFFPTIYTLKTGYFKTLIGVGLKFFVLQMAAVVFFQTDSIVVAHIFGPDQVSIFNICYKYFSVSIMGFSLIVSPLWSVFTEAYAKGDLDWIRRAMKKLKMLWILASFLTVVMVFASPFMFRIWVGEKLTIPLSLSLFMGAYMIVYMWQTSNVYLLNGIGRIQLQVYLVLVCASVNIPISIYLGRMIGMSGIVVSNGVLFLIMGFVFQIQVKRVLQGSAEGIWNK